MRVIRGSDFPDSASCVRATLAAENVVATVESIL
jgi:hypothetical protein